MEWKEYEEDALLLLEEMTEFEKKTYKYRTGIRPFFKEKRESFVAGIKFQEIKSSYETTVQKLGLTLEFIPDWVFEEDELEECLDGELYLAIENGLTFLSFLSSINKDDDSFQRTKVLLERIAGDTVEFAYDLQTPFDEDDDEEPGGFEDVFSRAGEITQAYKTLSLKECIIPYKRMGTAFARGYLKELLEILPYLKKYGGEDSLYSLRTHYDPSFFEDMFRSSLEKIRETIGSNEKAAFLYGPVRKESTELLDEMYAREKKFTEAVLNCMEMIEKIKEP